MQALKNNKKFIINSLILVFLTLALGIYVGNLLFYGKNSYVVYSDLQDKKAQLQQDIKRLHLENAKLQKQYLELKNLEPEEL
jgi:cell division protein FtsB